jgi:hypothetical protein
MTSRGVKCSPAVSLEISAELADQLLEDRAHLGVRDRLRVQVDSGELLRHQVEQAALVQPVIWVKKSNRSKMSRTEGENAWI